MNTTQQLISNITSDFQKGLYDKFISTLRLIEFKNIKSNETITFNFPLTVLVGENGIGKTSILHALFGTPEGHSTSQYWFPTPLDPDNDTDVMKRPRYVYHHWNKKLGKLLETSKTKVNTASRKDAMVYWEPRRPIIKDGMQKLNNLTDEEREFASPTGDRWTPPRRDCIFINQKTELGAFDRFSQDHMSDSNVERVKEITKASEKLRRVLDNHRDSYYAGGREQKILETKILSETELAYVNKILNKEYLGATYIRHSFYGKIKAPSAQFRLRDGFSYSEAFAGSGELAVVTLVLKILSAKKYSLVLIDEPETSLHPGAQRRLIEFLLIMINNKKLQIVISSHSPTIVELLPVNAIKVIEADTDGRDVKSRIIENVHHGVAFKRLGHFSNKINIYCEDSLMKVLVEVAITNFDDGILEILNIQVATINGADEILSNLASSWFKSGFDVYCFVDGDKSNSISKLPCIDLLTHGELKNIHALYKNATGYQIPKQFTTDEAISYIDWMKERIFCTECLCPEEILYNFMSSDERRDYSNQEYKDKVNKILKNDGFEVNSTSLSTLLRRYLIEAIKDDPNAVPTLSNIREKIMGILTKH